MFVSLSTLSCCGEHYSEVPLEFSLADKLVEATGAKAYFEVPLARAYNVFTEAYSQVAGLCRTVRGPSMSASPGKVMVDGITEVGGEKVFALKFLQGRDPAWANRLFFAKYDPKATWLSDLRPAFGGERFFFEEAMEEALAESERER